MDNNVTVIKDTFLLLPEKREVTRISHNKDLTVFEATANARKELEVLGFDNFVYTVDGYEVLTPELFKLKPLQQVTISVPHKVPAGVFVAMGMSATMAAVASTVATSIIMMGAGLLLQTIMAPSVPTMSSGSGKPSYSWGGVRNETSSGSPVPVAYGRPWSGPQILGSYRTVGEDFNVWQWLLLCASAGKTNNILTAEDIRVGEESLLAYEDYSFGATDGSKTITAATRTALTPFNKIHHDHPYEKKIIYDDRSGVDLISLVHFNLDSWVALSGASIGDFIVPTTLNGYCYECTIGGSTGASEPSWTTTPDDTTSDGSVTWTCREYTSAPVVDTSGRSQPWTKEANAQLKFDTPKLGNGYLNLPADGDYISTDDYEVLRLDIPGEIEFRFRLPDLNDRIILGQQISNVSYYGTSQSILSFGYKSGVGFFFQSVQGLGASIGAVSFWDVKLDAKSNSFTPDTNTWYCCRIQSYSTGRYNVLLGKSGTYSRLIECGDEEYVFIPIFDMENDLVDYSSETTTLKAKFNQQIGMGYYYNELTSSVSQLYGVCDIDEFRSCRGLANDTDNTDIPTVEFTDPVADPEEPYKVTTKSKVDQVRIIIEFSQGLFTQGDSGVGSKQVKFDLSYSKKDENSWTTTELIYSADSTSPVRYQKTLTFPSRDFYDVKLVRKTPESNNTNSERSESFLISFEEIIDLALYYPGLQVIALGIKASNSRSGQLGAIKVHHNRTLITVPTWDGESTMNVDATIPMWQLYDAFTNPNYGLNESPTTFIQDTWEEWEEWTEGDVYGNTRAKSHIVFDEPGSFSDNAITHIEQVGRARVMRIGDKWTIITDKPKESLYPFSAGNIVKGSYSWETYEEPQKCDAVEVTFWDEDRYGGVNTKIAKASWYNSLTIAPKIAQVEIRGVNNEEQAQREAQIRINKNEYITEHGQLSARVGAVYVEYGEVCTIVSTSSNKVFGGCLRKDHDVSSILYIDQEITLDEDEYKGKLKAYLYGETISGEEIVFDQLEYDVMGPWDVPTKDIVINGTFTGKQFDYFGLGRVTEDRILNQITNKSFDPNSREVKFEFVGYDERVFYSGEVAL